MAPFAAQRLQDTVARVSFLGRQVIMPVHECGPARQRSQRGFQHGIVALVGQEPEVRQGLFV